MEIILIFYWWNVDRLNSSLQWKEIYNSTTPMSSITLDKSIYEYTEAQVSIDILTGQGFYGLVGSISENSNVLLVSAINIEYIYIAEFEILNSGKTLKVSRVGVVNHGTSNYSQVGSVLGIRVR